MPLYDRCLNFVFIFAFFVSTRSAYCSRQIGVGETLPTLNDILNASQLDVRSSSSLPRPNDVRTLEIRAGAPLRQVFRTGDRVTRLAKIAIWFSGWSPSWTPEKSLVLTLYAGQDRSQPFARAVEPYALRRWEGAVHIFTLNALVRPDAEYAFELSVEGGGSLTGAGLASEPISPGVGELSQGGKTLDGALWFETIVKRRADLDAIYTDIFSHFDLSRPDLAPVRQAVAMRDWPAARQALIAHFESRKDLFPPQLPVKAPVGKAAESLELADLAVQHKVKAADEIVDLGPRWNHLAAWPARGGVGLTRSGLRGTLAAAYVRTHDEKYARAWNDMLLYQFEDLPSPLRAGVIAPDAQDILPIGEPGIGGGSMWASLSIAARMTHGFAYYRAFDHSPAFRPDTRFAFIVNLAEMSDVLEKMKGGGNWEAQNTTALLEFARTFPEFKKAPYWIARGFTGALQSCLDNTYPDGPLREASTNYHNLSLNRYLGVLETARKQGLPGMVIPATVRDRVEKMCDYLLFSTMPNGQLPRWGDSNPPTSANDLLLRAADYFNRPDFRWLATDGKSGTRPTETSRTFPEAGYYLMRSDWSPDAAFMGVHNGASSAHGHADANSLVLTAFGRELLIDPGVYIYGTPEAQLLSRSLSHNTVTMDDLDTRNGGGPARWVEGQSLNVYDGSNAGYAVWNLGDRAARHRRKVVFVKPDLFFVVDQASGDLPHDWALRYHFGPGTIEPAAGGNAVTFRCDPTTASPAPSRTGLRIQTVSPDSDLHFAALSGLTAAGWEKKTETPLASWTCLQTKTATWLSLLQPFHGSVPSGEWNLQRSADNLFSASQVTKDRSRTLAVSLMPPGSSPAMWTQDRLSGIADVVYWEDKTAAGQPANNAGTKKLLAAQARLVRAHGDGNQPIELLRAETPADLVEATWKEGTLTVHYTGGTQIRLAALGARRLIVNGSAPRTLDSHDPYVMLP